MRPTCCPPTAFRTMPRRSRPTDARMRGADRCPDARAGAGRDRPNASEPVPFEATAGLVIEPACLAAKADAPGIGILVPSYSRGSPACARCLCHGDRGPRPHDGRAMAGRRSGAAGHGGPPVDAAPRAVSSGEAGPLDTEDEGVAAQRTVPSGGHSTKDGPPGRRPMVMAGGPVARGDPSAGAGHAARELGTGGRCTAARRAWCPPRAARAGRIGTPIRRRSPVQGADGGAGRRGRPAGRAPAEPRRMAIGAGCVGGRCRATAGCPRCASPRVCRYPP